MSESDLSRTLTSTTPQRQRTKRLSAHLYVLSPPEVEGVYAIDAHETVVGRSPKGEKDILLAHDTISRQHLQVTWVGRTGSYHAKDMGSHNGSTVDTVTLSESSVELKHGSILKLGSSVLVFEIAVMGGHDVADAALMKAIPGHSTLIGRARFQIERCAKDPSAVILLGETGSGKEKVAQEIHRLSGRKGKLLSINCAALNAQLIESQLFGHVKGAFTGASDAQQGLFRAAQGGTLFLDEIGELPLELQPKLLRVLQEGDVMSVGGTHVDKVDVRIIAATNLNLAQEVEAERFRRDLYARLSLWQVELPPLRQRRSDFFIWLRRLAKDWCAERNIDDVPRLHFDAESVVALLSFSWPENLRGINRLLHELFSHAAFLGNPDHVFTSKDLPIWITNASKAQPSQETNAARQGGSTKPIKPSKGQLEAVLMDNEWSIRATAKYFDRDRKQIYRWIEKFELKDEEDKGDV